MKENIRFLKTVLTVGACLKEQSPFHSRRNPTSEKCSSQVHTDTFFQIFLSKEVSQNESWFLALHYKVVIFYLCTESDVAKDLLGV